MNLLEIWGYAGLGIFFLLVLAICFWPRKPELFA